MVEKEQSNGEESSLAQDDLDASTTDDIGRRFYINFLLYSL